MKVLAFGDLHGDKKALKVLLEKSKKADIIACIGDVSDWGGNDKEILDQFEENGIPMVIIHGNHEEGESLFKLCKKYKNIINIHRGSYEIDKFVFFGFGGGGFKQRNPDFEKIAKMFLKDKPKDKEIILLTHGPPYGTKLDYLPNLGHRGCESIREFIEKAQPLVHISGHLHETFGKKEIIGKTLMINPGPKGVILNLD